jgi:hypothetical protein
MVDRRPFLFPLPLPLYKTRARAHGTGTQPLQNLPTLLSVAAALCSDRPPEPHLRRAPAASNAAEPCRRRCSVPDVSPFSQILHIKNKTTRLLIIKDLHPSKHYLLLHIMISRRRS